MRAVGFCLTLLVVAVVPGGAFQTTAPPPQQQAPVFRAGVEVVTADVVVIDKSGRLVTDLKPSDFVVIADKRPRRVVSADYITARTAPVPPIDKSLTPTKVVAPPPAPSSNMHAQGGRTFIFAIDQDGIRDGDGHNAMARAIDYLNKLGPADRVGVVALPTGRPRVDLTTDRAVVARALDRLVGASMRFRDKTQMTPGEAQGTLEGNLDALLAFLARATDRPPGPPPPSDPSVPRMASQCMGPRPGSIGVPPECMELADDTLEQDRHRTRDVLSALGALATAMTAIPGPKTIVLVSSGLIADGKLEPYLRDFADACEKARVALYGIHLDEPIMEVATGISSSTDSTHLDDRYGFDGMSDIAYLARGEVIRSIATPDAALRQIDTETSGYYLLAFERDDNDKDGKREKIDVTVNRPGLDVRARAEFTPGVEKANATSIAPPADPKDAMAAMLAWPVAVSEVPLVLDTFVTPDADSAKQIHVLVETEISDYGRPLLGVGYEIDDVNGQTIANNFDAPPKVDRLDASRAAYTVNVPLPSGHFRMKVGVIDADGRRGSVEHSFDVPPYAKGLHVGDLMLGDPAPTGFRPLAQVPGDTTKLGALVDLRGDAAQDLQNVTATLHLIKVGTDDPIADQAITLKPTSDPLRVIAAATLNFAALPKGAYLAIVTVHEPGKPDAGRIRVFGK